MSGSLPVLGAPGLLGAAAFLTWLFGAAGLRPGRVPVAFAAWAALAILALQWLPARGVAEASGPGLGSGATLSFRLDGTAFAFASAILVAGGLLVTFQRRGWRSSGAAAALMALALLAAIADGLVLTALCWGALSVVGLVVLRAESGAGAYQFWGGMFVAALALTAAGAVLEVGGGTSRFSAVPVNTLGPAAAFLAAAGGLVGSGALPWRPWPVSCARRPRPEAAGLVFVVSFPLGLLLICRLEAAAGGHLPAHLQAVLAIMGLLTAAAAALRAQAAASREELHWEALVAMSGMAVMGLGIGTPAGVAGAVILMAAVVLASAAVSLGPSPALEIPVLAALGSTPPVLGFGGGLLVVESAYEQSPLVALLGAAAAVAWAVLIAALARGRAVAPHRDRALAAHPSAAGLALVVLLVAGVLGGVVASRYALPVAREVAGAAAAPAASAAAVTSAGGGWMPLGAGIPAAILIVVAGRLAPARAPGGGHPAPLAPLPRGVAAELARRLGGLRIPETYQSLFNPRALEAAMATGQPIMWALLLLALAVAVNR